MTVSIGFVVGLATLALASIKLPALGLILTTILALPFLLLGSRWLWGGNEPPPKLLALASDPAPGETFPVRVVLRRSGKPLIDHAMLTFVDGWLHVEGLRTSFSLRACDVGELVERGSVLALALPEEQRAEFRLLGGYDEKAEHAFHEALRIWHHYAIESPEGESRLPPL